MLDPEKYELQLFGSENEDGTVNVVDIVNTVNIIFSGETDCEEEPSLHGCLDSQACNYDSSALIDNNSCYYCYNNDCDTYPSIYFVSDSVGYVDGPYDCLGYCSDLNQDSYINILDVMALVLIILNN